MSTASNVEELVVASTRIERGRGYSPKNGGQQHRPNSPARQNHNRSGDSRQRNFNRGEYYRSPGGNKYFKNGSRSPGGNKYFKHGSNYNQRSSSKDRNLAPSRPDSRQRQRPPSAQRFRSQGGRNYYRSPGGSTWRRFSRSPTPSKLYNRGRPQQNDNKSGDGCLRCGGPHSSGQCPYYAYYQGPPCGDCGFLHATAAHKHRSGSRTRSTQQGGKNVHQHLAEIVPGAVTGPNNNQVNYFEQKNY